MERTDIGNQEIAPLLRGVSENDKEDSNYLSPVYPIYSALIHHYGAKIGKYIVETKQKTKFFYEMKNRISKTRKYQFLSLSLQKNSI